MFTYIAYEHIHLASAAQVLKNTKLMAKFRLIV